MEIIKTNFKNGTATLHINSQDDLWYLSHIIETGDLIKTKTTRKIKIGEHERAKVTKKTLTLKIEAETIELGEEGHSLRINGKVKEGTEDVPKDSYHSLSLEQGSTVTIEKGLWLSYQKQKLKEASERSYNYLICIFDREEALFALTKNFGYDILVKIKGDVAKKDQTITIKKDFHQELIKALDVYAGRYEPEAIILASPAFYKEDLFKKIKDKELKKQIVLSICSSVSEHALNEVLKRPELAQTLKESRAREEQLLIEELLSEINKKGLATYGWKEVNEAVAAGAVKDLLVSDDFIKQKKATKEFSQLDQQMKHVDTLKGKIHLLSSKQESGQKLNGLGGIAALLRFKLEWQ